MKKKKQEKTIVTKEYLQRERRILNTLADDTFDEVAWINEWKKWAEEKLPTDD